jgi:hypothetical protein
MRWQELHSYLARPLVHLLAGTVFSLTVAAQLGQHTLALTLISLVCSYTFAFWPSRELLRGVLRISVPLLSTWLLGHVAFGQLSGLSVLAALGFAVAFCGALVQAQGPERPWAGLVWQVLGQFGVAAVLVVLRQPLIAAVVALLVTPAFLLLVLLEPSPHGAVPGDAVLGARRSRYYHALQWPLAISMALAALAIGYTL